MSTVLTINLDNSDFFEAFKYPAGESQVRIKDQYLDMVGSTDTINVHAQLDNGEDVMKLALLADALHNVCARNGESYKLNLILSYLPYSRADRAFTAGDCRGLKTFARIIDSMCWDKVITLDVHNQAAAADAFFQSHFVNVDPEPLIEQAIGKFIEEASATQKVDRICVLFPDKGARERYTKIPTVIGCNKQIVDIETANCNKMRDVVTGGFLGFDVPELPNIPVLIVDDLCDGGGTFIGVASKIPQNTFRGLYVTHGVFSKGLKPLLLHFDKIYTTNSLEQVGDKSLTVLDCIPYVNKATL